jgi:hypothetical protein
MTATTAETDPVDPVAVPAGGLLAAMLLRRADRAESPRAAE